jgi:tetratricopeptide (TPR) repeat protein
MSAAPARRVGAVLAAALGIAAAVLVGSRMVLRTTPDLNEAGRLARAGRYDLARALVDDFLSEFPDDPRARLIAAELALDRPEPIPRLALEHLGRVGSFGRLGARAKLDEGKASYLLGLYGRAEACWLRALQLDPKVPEAAWALLDLYYVEGRGDEARRLALRQHEVEPDPHDRVHLLLELVRQDAEPPEPSSVIGRLALVVRHRPREARAAMALGLALVHDSRPDEGLATLRAVLAYRPDDPDVWDALLTGLDDAGRPAELEGELARVPPSLADEPRLLRHRGRAAQQRGDGPAAVGFYRRARAAKPDDLAVAYRLGLLLRAAGDRDGARPVEEWTRAAQAARDEARALYREADGTPGFGTVPRPDLYRRLADNRERLGRRDEARAWHRLVLEARPGEPDSRAALDRLK